MLIMPTSVWKSPPMSTPISIHWIEHVFIDM
jgi:hypothetical protein